MIETWHSYKYTELVRDKVIRTWTTKEKKNNNNNNNRRFHSTEEWQFPITACIWQPEIIVKRGYPVEIHSVTTKDGYILELHRIPPPTSRGNASRVVFLQHGLLHSSAAWVINPTNRSLGKGFSSMNFNGCYCLVSNSFLTGRQGLRRMARQRPR